MSVSVQTETRNIFKVSVYSLWKTRDGDMACSSALNDTSSVRVWILVLKLAQAESMMVRAIGERGAVS